MILRRVKPVTVEHFALGGTLEFIFDHNKDTDVYAKDSVVKGYINKLTQNHGFSRSKTIALVESTEVTQKMVNEAWEHMKSLGGDTQCWLITCGLKKIKEIGDMFADVVIGDKRKIIIVGGNFPIENRWHSDSHFNIPYVLAYVRYAMHLGEIVTFDGGDFVYHIKGEK